MTYISILFIFHSSFAVKPSFLPVEYFSTGRIDGFTAKLEWKIKSIVKFHKREWDRDKYPESKKNYTF